MKKIFVGLIVGILVFSNILIFVSDSNTDQFKIKTFVENREVIPVYTSHGIEKTPMPKERGKNTPPTVTITNPLDGATVSGTVTIVVSVIDREDNPDPTPIIKIDGTQVAIGFTYDWNTDLEEDGSHVIVAVATDTGGKTGTDSVTVTKGSGPGPVDKYALVIGISDYQGTSNDLQYCDDDALDWKNFLQSEGYSVSILTDTQATANNIDAAVDALLAAEDGNDYVVFTYSGHGARYSTYGSCIISTDLYYMSHGWLETKFASADSQHVYFAFDACQIGDFKGLIDTNKVGAFASNRRYSYDGDSSMKNGVFTYYQMIGWYDQNFASFEEDGNYAVLQMKNWANYAHVQVDPFIQDNFAGYMIP